MDISTESTDAQINRVEEKEYRNENDKFKVSVQEECTDLIGYRTYDTCYEAESHESGVGKKITEISRYAVNTAEAADEFTAEAFLAVSATEEYADTAGNGDIGTDLGKRNVLRKSAVGQETCDHRKEYEYDSGEGDEPEDDFTDRADDIFVLAHSLELRSQTEKDVDKAQNETQDQEPHRIIARVEPDRVQRDFTGAEVC